MIKEILDINEDVPFSIVSDGVHIDIRIDIPYIPLKKIHEIEDLFDVQFICTRNEKPFGTKYRSYFFKGGY